MTKFKLLSFAMATGLAMASCTSVQKSAVVMDDLTNRVIEHPLIGELETQPRTELTMTRREFKGAVDPEQFVTASLISREKADVLMEKRVEKQRSYNLFLGWRVKSVTVSGRPATYKNFHSMTREDYDLFIDPQPNNCEETLGGSAPKSERRVLTSGSQPSLLGGGLQKPKPLKEPKTKKTYTGKNGWEPGRSPFWAGLHEKTRFTGGFMLGCAFNDAPRISLDEHEPYTVKKDFEPTPIGGVRLGAAFNRNLSLLTGADFYLESMSYDFYDSWGDWEDDRYADFYFVKVPVYASYSMVFHKNFSVHIDFGAYFAVAPDQSGVRKFYDGGDDAHLDGGLLFGAGLQYKHCRLSWRHDLGLNKNRSRGWIDHDVYWGSNALTLGWIW